MEKRHFAEVVFANGSYSDIGNFRFDFSESAITVWQTFGSVVMLKSFFGVDVVG